LKNLQVTNFSYPRLFAANILCC